MAETWYKAWPSLNEITEVQVERHTAESVFIGGYRHARIKDWESFFKTPQEAFAFIRNQRERDIENKKKEILRLQNKLEELYTKYPQEYHA